MVLQLTSKDNNNIPDKYAPLNGLFSYNLKRSTQSSAIFLCCVDE